MCAQGSVHVPVNGVPPSAMSPTPEADAALAGGFLALLILAAGIVVFAWVVLHVSTNAISWSTN